MQSKVFSIKDISEALKPVFVVYNIDSATLFGSYAKNTATARSDVDLYVDSGLKGLKFVGFTEKVRVALGDKPVDILDKTHVSPDSRVMDEIANTGVQIYAR